MFDPGFVEVCDTVATLGIWDHHVGNSVVCRGSSIWHLAFGLCDLGFGGSGLIAEGFGVSQGIAWIC